MGYILSFVVGVIAGVTGLICIAVELDKGQNAAKEEPWKELERDCNGCFGAAGNDCQKCREETDEKEG